MLSLYMGCHTHVSIQSPPPPSPCIIFINYYPYKLFGKHMYRKINQILWYILEVLAVAKLKYSCFYCISGIHQISGGVFINLRHRRYPLSPYMSSWEMVHFYWMFYQINAQEFNFPLTPKTAENSHDWSFCMWQNWELSFLKMRQTFSKKWDATFSIETS